MRPVIAWILSILLGFEPAFAAAKTSANSEIKSFLAVSQIAVKPMALKDVYAKFSDSLSPTLKADLEVFMQKQGDFVLPRFDVNKISGPEGEELYQIQTVKDGKAISMTFVLGREVFMRVNGVSYTWNEMNDVRKVMAKVGVPAADLDENFPVRKPASNSRFLKAEQIQRLSPEQKKLYLRQFRDLIDSMEAVEKAFARKKSSFRHFPVFPTVSQGILPWFLGQKASASDAAQSSITPCPGPGTVTAPVSGGNLQTTDGVPVRAEVFPCNTQNSQTPQEFNKETAQVEKKLADSTSRCASSDDKSGDVNIACAQLREKSAAMAALPFCHDPTFNQNNPDVCSSEQNSAKPGGQAPLVQAPVQGQQSGVPSCSEEPLNMSRTQSQCEGGTVKYTDWLCLDEAMVRQTLTMHRCECDNPGATITAKMKCAGGTESAGDSSKSGKMSKAKKNNIKNWAIYGGIAALGIGLFYWLGKRGVDRSYGQIMPQTPSPAIPLPSPTTTLSRPPLPGTH